MTNTGEHAVVIAGAGPTGLTLAAELALAKVDVVIVERRHSQELVGSRAGGLHARSLEIFDQRGIAERFIREGQKAQVAQFAGVTLDLGKFPTRHNYGLGLWQNHIERILAEWAAELGVPVLRGLEVSGFTQDDAGVDVVLSDARVLRAQYLVGCDGGRSRVRKLAGIDFPGWDASTSALIAEGDMRDAPDLGTRRDALGIHGIGRVNYEIREGRIVWDDSSPVRVMVTEAQVGAGEPDARDISEGLTRVYGTDYGFTPTWISRFTDATRQAAAYRKGRVLLAGDAAHIHSPVGGQGLNLGVQDAMNLGWKLAQVIDGASPGSLLDTYHAERHPVAARALRTTMAAVALMRSDARTQALNDTIAALLGVDAAGDHMAGLLSGLDIRYEPGTGHPLLGRRMPDLDIGIGAEKTTVFALMHGARPLLLNFGRPDDLPDVTPWMPRLRVAHVRAEGRWELPVVGEVAAPGAVLVRPDGYVAWVGERASAGLADALHAWVGSPGA